MFKKILNALRPKNLKDLAIAIILFSLLVICIRGYFLLKNKESEHAIDKQFNTARIARLNKQIGLLLMGVKQRDLTIAQKEIIITNAINDKKKVVQDFEDFKNDLKKKSQIEKDKQLVEYLHNHEIEVKVLAENNYMQATPQERENLLVFVIDYDKLFNLHQINENILIPNLQEQNVALKWNVNALKKVASQTNEKCTLEKQNMQFDLDSVTKKMKKYKKDSFWSKVFGGLSVILTILILK